MFRESAPLPVWHFDPLVFLNGPHYSRYSVSTGFLELDTLCRLVRHFGTTISTLNTHVERIFLCSAPQRTVLLPHMLLEDDVSCHMGIAGHGGAPMAPMEVNCGTVTGGQRRIRGLLLRAMAALKGLFRRSHRNCGVKRLCQVTVGTTLKPVRKKPKA